MSISMRILNVSQKQFAKPWIISHEVVWSLQVLCNTGYPTVFAYLENCWPFQSNTNLMNNFIPYNLVSVQVPVVVLNYKKYISLNNKISNISKVLVGRYAVWKCIYRNILLKYIVQSRQNMQGISDSPCKIYVVGFNMIETMSAIYEWT